MFLCNYIRLLSLVVLAVAVFALPGKAAEAEKQTDAAIKYDNGLGHIIKAHKAIAKGDSLFAFNYRATSDSKARREYEKAIKDFNSATELNPKMVEAFGKLGYCYRKIGKLEESLASCNAAIKFNNKYEQAYEYRGETYLALGNIAMAKENLRKLESMDSALADTLSRAIEFYKLAKIKKKMSGKNR